MPESKFKILVIGDVMLDEYILVDHSRNSPEAPVPVLDEISREYRLGAACNVALNLRSMGSEPILISVCGQDETAIKIKEQLDSQSIKHRLVCDDSRVSSLKSRFVNSDFKQYFRLDKEDRTPLDQSLQKLVEEMIDEELSHKRIDAIIIQDYNKGLLTESLIRFIQSKAKSSDIPLFVDPKHKNFLLLSDCQYFKPNLNEVRQFLEIEPTEDLDLIIKKAAEILESPENLIITLGDKGIFYRNRDLRGILPAFKINKPDVSGAGDTVISSMCISHLLGLNIEQIAVNANKAGAISCSKKGVSVVELNEIRHFEG